MERLRAVVAAGPDAAAAAVDNKSSPLFENAELAAAANDADKTKKPKKKWGRKASSAPSSPYLEAAQREASFSSSVVGGIGERHGSFASLRSRSPPPVLTSVSSSSSLTRNASSGSISRIGSSGRILGVGERTGSAAPSPARPMRGAAKGVSGGVSGGGGGSSNAASPSLLSLSQASREELAAAAAAAAGGEGAATPPSSSPPSPTRSVASSAAGFPSPEPVAVSCWKSFFSSFEFFFHFLQKKTPHSRLFSSFLSKQLPTTGPRALLRLTVLLRRVRNERGEREEEGRLSIEGLETKKLKKTYHKKRKDPNLISMSILVEREREIGRERERIRERE